MEGSISADRAALEGNPIRASILPIAILYWASFVILTSVSAVLRGYDYDWVNVPLDASIILYATLAGLLIAWLIGRLKPLRFDRQALIALGGVAVGTFLFDTGFQLIRSVFGPDAERLTIATAVTRENILRGGLFWFVPLCLWAAAMLALLNNDKARERERQLFQAESKANEQLARAAEAEARATRLELDTLRLQLNPHFMCNSLNAISTLVLAERLDEADAALGSLADFLRASTETADRRIRLAEELATIGAYLRVESIRFGERLRTELEFTEEALNALLPNFILQPLVENAIKYGVGRSKGSVRIRLSGQQDGDKLIVTVEDDGRGSGEPGNDGSGGGVGLANIRSRLRLHYGTDATLEAGNSGQGYRSTLRLPLTPAGSG